MPHPHYSAGLERDFYYSQVKAAELISLVAAEFPDFPREIDGVALCQHHGLPTACLDFSEDVWVSGFFATHEFKGGGFTPCRDGIGVMYVLETDQITANMLYEIGIQPLPRPFVQRGSLLKVTPEINLLAIPAVWSIFFKHDVKASRAIGEKYNHGSDLVPNDTLSLFLESRMSIKSVSSQFVDVYLSRVPSDYQETLRGTIHRLFDGYIKLT